GVQTCALPILESQQQKLGSAIYSLVPPPAPDGTETRKGGSKLQLKFDLTDSETGNPITYATAFAEYTTDGISFTRIGDFTFNGADGHYALQFPTPRVRADTILYVNYIVDMPGDVENRTLADPANIFVDPEGHQATIELTLTK
ncbi:MAG TPA: hypothetical protein VD699_04545, partial [Nitrosopumilaceae archaeon]|nr:hypothetical protein [Nitrosopumilaceae archaeon]